MKNKKAPPLKIGKETFGNMDIKKAFQKALAPYFMNQSNSEQTKSKVG